MKLTPVPCPRCNRKKAGAIVMGVSQFQCPTCKLLITAGLEKGGMIRYLHQRDSVALKVAV